MYADTVDLSVSADMYRGLVVLSFFTSNIVYALRAYDSTNNSAN